MDLDSDGIHQLIYNTINKANFPEISGCEYLYSNIVLSGGSSMFENLEQRLKKEIEMISQSTYKVNVIASPDRKYATFRGASILSKSPCFKDMIVARSEYYELGPDIIKKNFYNKKNLKLHVWLFI